MTNESQYVTRAEAAALAGLSIENISYRIRAGQLHTIKDPGDRRRVIIKRAEVEALAQRLTAHREPQPQ